MLGKGGGGTMDRRVQTVACENVKRFLKSLFIPFLYLVRD